MQRVRLDAVVAALNEIRRAPDIWSAGVDHEYIVRAGCLGPVLGGGLRRGVESPGHEVNTIDHGDQSRTKRAVEMSPKVDILMTPLPSS